MNWPLAQPFAPVDRRVFGPEALPSPSCDADRVLQAGGALTDLLMPRGVTPFQWTFRKYPSAGFYTATREKPFQFVLGTFVVPPEMTLALAEYRVRPYRFSGIIAGEPVPLEERRLSLSMGYDLTTATVGRPGNLNSQILPGSPSITENPAYPQMPTGGTIFPSLPVAQNPLGTISIDTIYGVQQINNQANAPGLQPPPQQPDQYITTLFGSGMLPQNQDGQQGPSKFPFTYYINEKDNVTLSVGVFSSAQIPLALIEGVFSGYLMSKTTLEVMLNMVRPCT